MSCILKTLKVFLSFEYKQEFQMILLVSHLQVAVQAIVQYPHIL